MNTTTATIFISGGLFRPKYMSFQNSNCGFSFTFFRDFFQLTVIQRINMTYKLKYLQLLPNIYWVIVFCVDIHVCTISLLV